MICYLIDVDGTLLPHGERELSRKVIENVNALSNGGNEVYLFTCRSKGSWIDDFRRQGLKFVDVIEKPVADAYVIIDDRFLDGVRSVNDIPMI